MTEIIIIFGMLAAYWSGFFMGYYRREGKAPEIPLPTFSLPVVPPQKPEQPDKEQRKVNTFFE